MATAKPKSLTPSLPLAQACEDYLAWAAGREKSPQTIRGYTSDFRGFQAWLSDQKIDPDLATLTDGDLVAYKRSLVDRGLKPSTINRPLSAIGSLMRWAAQEGRLTRSYTIPQAMRQITPPPRWLDKAELRAVVREIERGTDPSASRSAALMLWCGMRASEAAAAKWGDFELGERKGIVRILGKGRKRRTVPVPVECRRALGHRYLPNDMPVLNGLTYWGIDEAMGRLAERTKIAHLTAHVLRHTYCHQLAQAGCRLEEIAALAGHESVNTTRRYCEPGQDDLAAAVHRAFGGGEDDPAPPKKGGRR